MLAPVMCAGVTCYNALKTANIVTGAWVGISGAAGAAGSLALSYESRLDIDLSQLTEESSEDLSSWMQEQRSI
jgi:Zn-dependent alcohol dehydrogenases